MSQSYRLKIERQSLKLKVATRIPARLEGSGGLSVVKSNGVYTISPTAGVLGDVTGPGTGAAVAGELAVFTDGNNIDGSGIQYTELVVDNHAVAIGTGGTGFNSASPGTIGRMLVSNGAAADPSFVLPPFFNVSLYASLQAACDATQTGDGGIVFIDTNATLGTTKLNLDGFVKPLRITGRNVANGGGAWVPYIRYAGTGSAITLANTSGVEIDHCFIWTDTAGVTAVNAKDASNFQLHNNTIYQPTTSASNIGVDLDTAVSPQVIRNSIFSTGGRGIRGVAPAGSFSIRAEIARNYFGTDTNISISAPGQAWSIAGNTAQNPATCFIEAGPAGTCDVLHISDNDIDDITGTKTIITSNASVTNSENNRFAYVSGTITCIAQTNSTGAVISSGDRLSGTVGIAVGTGNYLSIEAPAAGGYAPTTLYTGTPANTNVIKTIGGALDVTGKVTLGIEGVYGGAQRFWSSNSGYVELVVGSTVLGTNTVTIPAHGGATLLSNTGTQTAQNKTLDNTNIVTLRDDRFTLQDSADTTKQATFELSGLTTATTTSFALPSAGIASAATANTLVSRDANGSSSFTNITGGYTTTVTAAGTTTLTAASNRNQFFTGTTTQTVELPVASTLALGHRFDFENNSTGLLTVQSSGGNIVAIIAGGGAAFVTCTLASGTDATSWHLTTNYTNIFGGKLLTVQNTLTFAGTDGSTLAIGAGGTLGSNAYTSTAYAPLASPTLTGTPAAPTASPLNNSTQIATTAYADAAVAAKGTSVSITPTWSGGGTPPALGNGTLTGTVSRLGPSLINVSIKLTAGSTTTFGTSYWTFSLPSPYNTAATGFASCISLMRDGGTNYMGIAWIQAGTTVIYPHTLAEVLVSATVPFTWGTGDTLELSLVLAGP